MTDIASGSGPAEIAPDRGLRAPIPAWLFAIIVFVSAGLVFMVEPMIARLVLPVLGGSAAVWNTSLAFFQAALLVGYVYAHLLQRLPDLRAQIVVHAVVLVLAAIALPLRVTGMFGEPPPDGAPALWLVAVLAVSIGAPFAALSATAPLVQAWYARVARPVGGREPYVLYAASNFGSLIALIAYPVLVEPNVTLRLQTGGWSVFYGVFVILAAVLGAAVWRAGQGVASIAASEEAPAPPTTWGQRLAWLVLAAIPSSLMLGVTAYITTDLGSAPFLWVAPLALYLATFIIAFQEKPAIPREVTLILQAAMLALACVFIHFLSGGFVQELAIHLSCFFLTALMCHQALVARRPPPARLTEFYIWMSLGGVVGGSFNAFIAPVIFNSVVEYPALLVLSCLVRPWGRGPVKTWEWACSLGATAACVVAVQLLYPTGPVVKLVPIAAVLFPPITFASLLLGAAGILAFLIRGRAVLFMVAIFVLIIGSQKVSDQIGVMQSWRGFFGVLRLSELELPSIGGKVWLLSHGTTVHGAQAQSPRFRCRPLVYYAPETPIGQVFTAVRAAKPAINVGAVGLGTGAVAAYTRPGDSLRFFEIDPLVLKVTTDPKYFTYVSQCARGHIAYSLGDARLTLAKQPAGQYDILLIDAFSSDSVPAHLLTVEAARMYLSKLKPDGILIFHLSNRNLDLMRPAQAVALAAGGQGLAQEYWPPKGVSYMWASGEQAVIVAKSRAALAPFAADPRWTAANPEGVRPWTDDYTNLFGALVRRTAERWEGKR